MHPFEENKCSYLDVPNGDRSNRLNNETYNLRCTNIKIIMTIKIWIDNMCMHCCIIMYNTK